MFLMMFLTLYFAVLFTTQGPVKMIYCASHCFLYNRQNTAKYKGLILTAIISTYLQLKHVHLFTCQFLVIFTWKHFAFGSFCF